MTGVAEAVQKLELERLALLGQCLETQRRADRIAAQIEGLRYAASLTAEDQPESDTND